MHNYHKTAADALGMPIVLRLDGILRQHQAPRNRPYFVSISELVDAWLNTVEAKQQIEAVGNELKSRIGA